MKIQEAVKIINDFIKTMERALFVLEKESINIELKKKEVEAFRILMTRFEELDTATKVATKEEFEKKYICKDRIMESLNSRIESIEKLLDDMVDKSIGGINVSGLNKKEKEEVIAKRNGLLVQRATLHQLKEELLKEG